MKSFSLGLDFGTNSIRALIVRCADGLEVGSGAAEYRSGEAGVICDRRDPHVARQHPGDYLPALERSVRIALGCAGRARGFTPERVVAIGVDGTGSSPLPIDRANRPLACLRQWRRHPAAQCWLWKDHTSWREAAAITAAARRWRPAYLETCGGAYSSEWFWAKLWHCARVAPEVFRAAHSWVELSDWVASALAGIADPAEIVRSKCLAGFKAMYAERWGGLPDERFLSRLDPRLARVREHLCESARDVTSSAGRLSRAWAEKLGLRLGIPIANAGLDCHAGAIGCGVAEGTLVKIIGTSGCDCAVLRNGSAVAAIPGVCGQAVDGILPGWIGLEAGQPAVGDIFRWWVEVICEGDATLHDRLTAAATKLGPGESGLLALDWHNGNRTVLADHQLSGLILGCTLQTSRAEVYRALIEAAAFGSRAIFQHLRAHHVPIRRMVCAGGIARKNPLLMQIYSDVLGCTIGVSDSVNASALGSAIAAAVAAGIYPDLPAAQVAMVRAQRINYHPNRRSRRIYDRLFAHYLRLHDAFGGVKRAVKLATVMKELPALKVSTPTARAT